MERLRFRLWKTLSTLERLRFRLWKGTLSTLERYAFDFGKVRFRLWKGTLSTLENSNLKDVMNHSNDVKALKMLMYYNSIIIFIHIN